MTLTLGRRRKVLVEVFTRQGCGLCEAAEDLVAAEARGQRIRFTDVDDDPDLQARYHVRVPVVEVDGREVADGGLAPGVVHRAVRRARRGRGVERPGA